MNINISRNPSEAICVDVTCNKQMITFFLTHEEAELVSATLLAAVAAEEPFEGHFLLSGE